MSTEYTNLEVDVYWSMHCPYAYIALNRCLEMQMKYHLNLNLHVAYPNVVTDPDAIHAMEMLKYRIPYQDIDSYRNAHFHRSPMRAPDPDIIVRKANKDGKDVIAPLEEQIYAQFLVRTAIAANEIGKGWEYLNEVMRMVFNGQKKPWAKPDDFSHVINAINGAGIDADKLVATVEANPKKYDDIAIANAAKQRTNDSRHMGIPNFVFGGEPFFGQDRIAHLIWRMELHGLTERADYEPSARARNNPDFWA